MRAHLNLLAAASVALLSACGTSPARLLAESPSLSPRTASNTALRALPPPKDKLYVAVFAFQDQTGQHKPNDNYADYSFAVTQGGASILVNALQDAGNRSWFTVLERSRLGDLFQERQIIRANREEAALRQGRPMQGLGPLLNAGIIFEGGIIGYDTNVLSGGAGATFLGIGATTQYRRDNVAVYLRVVSVLTGEVLVAVTTEKTIYSISLNGSLNRYVGFNKLLQAETGFSTNEPGQLAVRQAIELAVRSAILDGAEKGHWHFADPATEQRLVDEYVAERDGTPRRSPSGGAVQARSMASGSSVPIAATGSPAPIAATGSPAPTAATGSPAPTAATGWPAPIAATGWPAPTAATGSPAPIAATGSPARTAAAGWAARTAATGWRARTAGAGSPAPTIAIKSPAPTAAIKSPAPSADAESPAPTAASSQDAKHL